MNDDAKEAVPVIGAFPATPLAAVAALPNRDDPAKVEVQYVLANAIACEFVEILVIGVRAKSAGGGFTWFGSSQDVVRAVGMVEVCKRDMLRSMTDSVLPSKGPA